MNLNQSFYRQQATFVRVAGTFLLALLIACLCHAQKEQIIFDHINVKDGLPEPSVFGLLQDEQGFIWMGTQSGLVKYDGYDFKVYKAVTGDTTGQTPGGISYRKIIQGKDGKIWTGGKMGGGLSSFDPNTEKFTNYNNSPADNSLHFEGTTVLMEDVKGRIWFRTIAFRRDTNRIECYNPTTGKFSQYPITLGNNLSFGFNFWAITTDKEGHVWVGDRNKGIYQYQEESDSFQLVIPTKSEETNSLSYKSLYHLMIDDQERMWVSTPKGLNKIDLKTKEVIPYFSIDNDPTSLQNDTIRMSYQDKMGNIWASTRQGHLHIYQDQSNDFKHYSLNKAPIKIYDKQPHIYGTYPLVEDEKGIWFYVAIPNQPKPFLFYSHTNQSFTTYDNQFNHPDNTINSYPASAMIDDSGLLWIGNGWGGVNKQNPTAQRIDLFQYNQANKQGLASDTIIDIYEDSQQDIWISTFKGISRFKNKDQTFESYSLEKKKDNYFTATIEDNDKRLWHGSAQGLHEFDRKLNRLKLLKHPKFQGSISYLEKDNKGNIWVSINGIGVRLFNPYSRELVHEFLPDSKDSTSLQSKFIYHIYKDAKGRIWLSSYRDGLSRYNPSENNFIQYKANPDDTTAISDSDIHTILEDSKGQIWVGTNGGGLNLYNETTDNFSSWKDNNSFVCLLSSFEDSKGNLWFGTYLNGLYRFEPETEKLTQYATDEGLTCNSIMIIEEDNFGNLWLPTEKGLFQFDPQKEKFKHFGASDGFISSPPRSWFNLRVLKSTSGHIWIGGEKGLHRIQPSKLVNATSKSPPIWINALDIGNQKIAAADGKLLKKHIAYSESIHLSHTQNDLTLGFVGLDYARSSDNQYSYILENLDTEWSPPSTERKVRYTNLAPGTYIFKVKGSNADGVWNETPATLRIVIAPPWWQTWWAYLGYLALLGLGIFAFTNWRTKRLRLQRLALEEKVKERTEEIGKRVEELQVVNQISQAAASELEFDSLVQLVGEEMRKTFGANLAYVAIKEPNQSMIQFPYQYGETLAPLKYGEGLTSQIIKTGQPLLVNQDVKGAYEKYGLQERGTVPDSYLGVPIKVGQSIIGVLSVQKTKANQHFSQEDQRLLSTIASNVGVAIRNAQLYRESQIAKANAEEANNAKSSFLSTVSHELRTPLTSVLGFAKIIKKRLEDRIFPQVNQENPKIQNSMGQVSKNLNVVISEGERLTQLINDVLDLAKIEAGKIEWHIESVSIQEVIDRAIAGTNALFINKNLPLSKDLQADLPSITGDRNKLIQVMINLLSNAVKFTDEGEIHCRAYQDKGEIIISVKDSGIGIAEADIEKVFEKFKQVGDTLTDKPQGTGLGLPICKEIVEHHGGRIWATSELNKGSTFFFSLPILAKNKTTKTIQFAELVTQLKNQIIKSPVPLNGVDRTILIVDDDTPIRSLLRQELEEAGYLIKEAENGRAALEAVRQDRPDLILLDVMMPEMNGFDVAAVLKNDPATMDIPIIIISIVQDEKRGYRIGVDRYLTKPIDTEKLFKEVDDLLEQGKSKKKVLVVDEDASAIKTLADVLQNRGYLVEESNGQELLEKAMSAQPDIIILNALLNNNQEIIKTLRFEKGLENVLFFVYQ